MKIADLNGKTVCVLGYGREGTAMVNALLKYAPECKITVADQNEKLIIENGKLETQLGKDWLNDMNRFDVLIKSPGISPSELFQLSIFNFQLTSSTQIFLDTIADRGAITIGVTGSKGKSTTSSLLYAILKATKKDVILTGNIGEPSIAHLDDVKKGTIVVMEMSSYQLMDLTVSPHIAIVTSFFPEHLDYHGSLEAYLEAKKHITKFQQQDDMVFFNAASPDTAEIAKEGDGTKIPFTPADCPVSITETRLIGEHNCGNIAAACMVASMLGAPAKTAMSVVRTFEGLPHRLQSLGVHYGIEWIDDAISTTPESTIAAIAALNSRLKTIILGGADRGIEFDLLRKAIHNSSIKNIIFFRKTSGKMMYESILLEAKIADFLSSYYGEFIVERCPNLNGFKPDFYLPELNLIIEAKVRIRPETHTFFETLKNNFDIALISKDSDFLELDKKLREKALSHGRNVARKPKGIHFKEWFGVDDMEEAVRVAKKNTPAGSICLLSTASPSYGMFKNFEEKGERFKECIAKI